MKKLQSNKSPTEAQKFVMRAMGAGFTPSMKGDWIVWPGDFPKDLFMEGLEYDPNVLAQAVRDVESDGSNS